MYHRKITVGQYSSQIALQSPYLFRAGYHRLVSTVLAREIVQRLELRLTVNVVVRSFVDFDANTSLFTHFDH